LAFEGTKDKLKDAWSDFSSKIQEQSWFNNLREKFEEQSPPAQRAIVAAAIVLFSLFLLSFPYSYISSSQDYMSIFETNRTLIQGLLHASRAAKEPSPLPPPLPAEALKQRVEGALRENRLVSEQIGEIANLPDRPAKDLSPAAVIQAGIAVQAKKLNVSQLVAVNLSLQNLGPGIKLMGLDIVQTTGQTHYYDMVARVVSFGLPQINFEADAPGGGKQTVRRPSLPKIDDEAPE